MRTSELFNDVMMLIWDGADRDLPKEAVAIASYVKSHRINAENAFEVINIMWLEGAKVAVRADGEGIEPGLIWFDVTFADGSQVMINAPMGIGSWIEVIS